MSGSFLTLTDDGQVVPLDGSCPIGRQAGNRLLLPGERVSRQHALIQWQRSDETGTGAFLLIDLGSSNGLKVNGARVESKFLLPGDELTIAKHRFAIQYEPLSDAPPPEDDNPFSLSLMEKAGLVNKRRKKKADSSHEEDLLGDASKAKIAPRPKSTGNQQEDQIMQWLSED